MDYCPGNLDECAHAYVHQGLVECKIPEGQLCPVDSGMDRIKKLLKGDENEEDNKRQKI